MTDAKTIPCGACDGTGHADTDPKPCDCACHAPVAGAACARCTSEHCSAMSTCQVCDGEGTLDYATVKYWFDQAGEMSSRLHREAIQRIDAELSLSLYERTRQRRAA